MSIKDKKQLSWMEVENHIEKEIKWLKSSLTFHYNPNQVERHTSFQYGYCDNCILRKIALLISSGEVRARDIRKENSSSNFWLDDENVNKTVYHGGEWHREIMGIIENHFRNLGCEVAREPYLPWGRADIGVYKENVGDLFVEVGSISTLKLFINLKKLSPGIVYLVVPDDDGLVEFLVN